MDSQLETLIRKVAADTGADAEHIMALAQHFSLQSTENKIEWELNNLMRRYPNIERSFAFKAFQNVKQIITEIRFSPARFEIVLRQYPKAALDVRLVGSMLVGVFQIAAPLFLKEPLDAAASVSSVAVEIINFAESHEAQITLVADHVKDGLEAYLQWHYGTENISANELAGVQSIANSLKAAA